VLAIRNLKSNGLPQNVTRSFAHQAGLFLLIGSLLGGLTALSAGTASAADWPQFRGADARGVADHPGLPDRWSESENILWKQPVAGRGWSSPIISGERIFLTTVTRDEGRPEEAKPGLYFGGDRPAPDDVIHEWQVLCLSLTDGRQLWQRTVHRGKPQTPRHIKNSYASETPVTDGERVYALFGDVGLYCLTVDGKPVWEKSLPACKTRFDWGTAASPVLHEDRIYMVSDNEQQSYITALDKRSGEQVWQVDRDEKSNWATPFIWQNELRTEIITPGTGKTRSYDLDGNLLYEFGGGSNITIATPYTAHGLLYVSSGYVLDGRRPIFALRPGAAGDISLTDDETSNESIVWCQKQEAPYNPTTIVYGDQLYVLHDRGFVTSFDATTGQQIYGKQRLPNGRAFTVSPWASNGKIFCLNEFGETFVIRAGRQFELLHRNKLDSSEVCMATPAFAGSRIVLRTGDHIYCIGE
jgi:outer membrane protein assembly factor BamB